MIYIFYSRWRKGRLNSTCEKTSPFDRKYSIEYQHLPAYGKTKQKQSKITISNVL